MFGYTKPNQRDVADNYPKQSQLSTGASAGYTNQTAFASLNCWELSLCGVDSRATHQYIFPGTSPLS